MSKSIHYFRFYRQSQDGAKIPEESAEEEESEESDRSTVNIISVLIIRISLHFLYIIYSNNIGIIGNNI